MSHASAPPPTVEEIAATIAAGTWHRRVLVAIDGGDASGKTTYAARLASAIRDVGRRALVIHVDDFMHVRAVRHRRGRTSPEGYLDDSYDYQALSRYVLEPLSASGDGRFRAGCVDRFGDVAIDFPVRYASTSTVTVVEGLFLLRDELARWWDYSVFLDLDNDVALSRKSKRDGLALSPESRLTRRYVEGQRMYRERYRPHDQATWIVANAG